MTTTHKTEEIKRIDGMGRLNFGKALANEHYRIERATDGTITLTPVVVIPKREMWLWSDNEALASVKEGLNQSARGEATYIRSFAQNADDEDDDND